MQDHQRIVRGLSWPASSDWGRLGGDDASGAAGVLGAVKGAERGVVEGAEHGALEGAEQACR